MRSSSVSSLSRSSGSSQTNAASLSIADMPPRFSAACDMAICPSINCVPHQDSLPALTLLAAVPAVARLAIIKTVGVGRSRIKRLEMDCGLVGGEPFVNNASEDRRNLHHVEAMW